MMCTLETQTEYSERIQREKKRGEMRLKRRGQMQLRIGSANFLVARCSSCSICTCHNFPYMRTRTAESVARS